MIIWKVIDMEKYTNDFNLENFVVSFLEDRSKEGYSTLQFHQLDKSFDKLVQLHLLPLPETTAANTFANMFCRSLKDSGFPDNKIVQVVHGIQKEMKTRHIVV